MKNLFISATSGALMMLGFGANALAEDDGPVLLSIKHEGKAGFMNTNGVIVIPAIYEKVYPFTDGLAAVQVKGKWGFIDATGKMVIKPQFADVGLFSDGMASYNDEIWMPKGYINKKGEKVIKAVYDVAEPFHDGVARVGIQRGGLTPEERRVAFFGIVPDDKVHEFAQRAMLPYNYHYINCEGEKVEDPGPAHNPAMAPGELINFQKGDKWGYKNAEGKVVIEPKFAGALAFHEGLAAAHDGKAYGYIDKSGEFVIPPQYEYANEFSDGLAGVRLGDDGWGFIDKKGNVVIPAKYNWVYEGFKHGLVEVVENGEAYYINKNGEKIIPKEK